MATLNVKGLPDGLYRKLRARAKRERRSVAQETSISSSRPCSRRGKSRSWTCAAWARSTSGA